MDLQNRFATRTTFALLRAEYAVGLIACTVAFFWHVEEVRWLPAIALFVYIDVIGYLPGLLAHLRSKTGAVPKPYYVLYNVMHSLVTQAAVIGIWCVTIGFEWALLAIPIHLFGDRAIFGNFVKSFRVPFEPKPLPAFVEFERRLVGAPDPVVPVAAPVAVGGVP